MARRADFRREWDALGSAVAERLPKRTARRLLAALQDLASAPPLVASDAIAALQELATGRPVPPLGTEEMLALLRHQSRFVARAHRERSRRRAGAK